MLRIPGKQLMNQATSRAYCNAATGRCPAKTNRCERCIERGWGVLINYHAVLVIRGDTSGKITIANWGEFSHGRLVKRGDGQWFVPDDPKQHEL